MILSLRFRFVTKFWRFVSKSCKLAGRRISLAFTCHLANPPRTMMRYFIRSLALLSVMASPMAAPIVAQQATPQRAVVVTGASSGIGRKITELLASQGHFVYAGARK